jgi:hypothetical protein
MSDSQTTFMCRLFWKLEASTFWNHQGFFQPRKEFALEVKVKFALEQTTKAQRGIEI